MYHTAWSEMERDRLADEDQREEHGDVAVERLTRLHSITPEGVPLYVEVEEEQ